MSATVARPRGTVRWLCLLALAGPTARSATVTVTSAGDGVAANGAVTLREAMLSMNGGIDLNADVTAHRSGLYGSSDEVRFAIGSGAKTIVLAEALPLVEAYAIDGTSQPGFVDAPLITIDGDSAPPGSLGLHLTQGAAIDALELLELAGGGVLVSFLLFADGFELGGPAAWGGATSPAAGVSTVSGSIIRACGGDGVAVEAPAGLVLSGSSIVENLGRGLVVRGGLEASESELVANADHGVVVESDRRVELVEVAVRESGGHPDAPAPGRAGVLVLRASATSTEPLEDGFVFRQGEISDNSGHGLILGDLTGQSGPVSAIVLGNVVSGNLLGIEVQQANSTTKRTATTIRGNEIVDNLDSGIYLRTSFQKPVPGDETLRLVFNDNVIAHNAVVGGCTPMAGDQSAAQVVVEGPVGGTDPTVSIPPGDCHLDNCGPDAEHPEDRLCFWGLGLEEPRVSNQSECNELSDPAITAAGANHHCVWTGATCRVGWDLGGTEVPNACSGENSFHGYVADPIAAPLTQRGLTALQGAMVRARFNLWGNGGELEGFAVDSGFGSHVEVGQSCGLDSGCP